MHLTWVYIFLFILSVILYLTSMKGVLCDSYHEALLDSIFDCNNPEMLSLRALSDTEEVNNDTLYGKVGGEGDVSSKGAEDYLRMYKGG